MLGRDRAAEFRAPPRWTAAFTSSQRSRKAALSMPTGWLMLKWMLPSPRWPKGKGRAPGTSATTARSARAMQFGHRRHRHGDVVLDRAALLLLHLRQRVAEAPERRRLLRGSRRGRRPRRGPCRSPRAKIASIVASASSCERLRRDLDQHVPGMRRGERIARAGHDGGAAKSMPIRGISSKAVSALPAMSAGDVEERERRRRALSRRRRRR